MHLTSRLTLLAAFAIVCGHAVAGDWPQILGPNRDGIAVDEKLLAEFPQTGPETVWSVQVGEGFAGVAVRNGVTYVFHRVDNQEIVAALDATTGQELWSQGFPCQYQSGISSDAGPRCVPVVSRDRVFVYGVAGQLRCLDAQTGKPVWSRDTWQEFSAPEGYFGAGSTPVLFNDRLIVNVGGRDNAAVVAFSAADGSTLWQSFSDAASYAAPIVAKVDGAQHAIVVTRLNVVSLNPADGTIRFSFPFGARGPTVNGATPVILNDKLFVTASYRVGSVWATISADDSQTVASGEDLLASQYATPVQHQNLLFAVDGRQDVGTATLKCLDPARQKVLWSAAGFDYGTLIRVNDELLFVTCAGDLIRYPADPTRFREISRSRILNPTPSGYRLPALSNGRLFVRDDSQLKCLQVGEQP